MAAFCRFFPTLLLFVLLATPVCAASEGILLVAFGTSVPSGKKAFDSIEHAYQQAYPDIPIVWAFTSQIIRKKLAKQGVKVGSIGQGLEQLAQKGVKVVRVQSLHMMAGEEFAALARSLLIHLQKKQWGFNAVYLGRPLLESQKDAEEVAAAVASGLKSRQKGEGLVLMGHGQSQGRADLVFEGTRSILKRNDPLVFMASVEGTRDFEDMAKDLQNTELKTVWLAPFMVVAGDHAHNDLAGEEADSWKNRLAALGYNVKTDLHGLGENPAIANIFVRHTRESVDNLLLEPRKP